MTSPRTPRQVLGWTVPDHIDSGTIGRWVNVTCRHGACHGTPESSRTYYVPAMSVAAESAPFMAFLRSHAHGGEVANALAPLSEVLPETPEPPRDLRAEATRWAVGQALSRGEEIEIPGLGIVALDEEPPPGCCGGCDGSGRVPDPDTGGYCADCYGTGHLHTGPCTPAPVPAPQSVPAVPVSSTGGKETGEAAETATEALRLPAEVQHRIDEIAVGVKAMAKVAHTLAVVVAKSNRPDMAGWLAEVAIAINAGREWPILAPLPDSETEVQWSVREQGDERFYYHPTTDEEDAREEAACREGNTLGKRQVWYGPWIEVTS